LASNEAVFRRVNEGIERLLVEKCDEAGVLAQETDFHS
jgi:hypothetical protein